MKKAIIHIGSGKTGTTSIQKSLAFSVRDKGLGASLSYPLIDRYGHQHIELLFKNKENLVRGLKSAFDSGKKDYVSYKETYRDVLERELKKEKDAIISSEYLFSFGEKEVLDLKDCLLRFGFSDFKVLAYIRSPESYYLSLIQQKLKASYNIPSPEKFRCEYVKSLAKWEKVFGAGSLEVREFDRDLLFNGDICSDFGVVVEKYLGVSAFLQPIELNESLSAEQMVILQRFRRKFYSDSDDRFFDESNNLIKDMNKFSKVGVKAKLKQETKAKILENHSDEIALLRKKFGIFGGHKILEDAESFRNKKLSGFKGDVAELLEGISERDVFEMMLELLFEKSR